MLAGEGDQREVDALSISSTHMKTTIALRRVSTPTQPIVNRIAESTRYGVTLIGLRLLSRRDPAARPVASRTSWRCTASMSSASAGAERTVPRAASTRDTEASEAVPSGSSAGVSTALCRAKTPGVGSGPGCVPLFGVVVHPLRGQGGLGRLRRQAFAVREHHGAHRRGDQQGAGDLEGEDVARRT